MKVVGQRKGFKSIVPGSLERHLTFSLKNQSGSQRQPTHEKPASKFHTFNAGFVVRQIERPLVAVIRQTLGIGTTQLMLIFTSLLVPGFGFFHVLGNTITVFIHEA